MNHPAAINWLLAVLLGCLSSPVDAQINLKAGYNFSWIPDPGTDPLIHLFQSPQHTASYHELNWLHGFEAGLRYKADMHAIEIGYQGGYRSLRATGTSVADGASYTDKLKFAVHSGTIGYLVSGEVFGLGAELQHQWYKTVANLNDPAASFRHIQPMWAYSFFMTFTFTGNHNIDMMLKPYYTIPDKSYDTEPLRAFNGTDIGIPRKKWTRFGISIVFYNGPKA